jgi:peptide/nickel transport system permease protein
VRHLLPSFMSYLIVDADDRVSRNPAGRNGAVFLGLGLREPVESWGVLLFAAQNIRSIDQACPG